MQSTPEEWRTIAGHPNYQVSNRGQVRRVGHWTEDRLGRKTYFRERALRPIPRAGGYLEVGLWVPAEKRRTRGLIHVLVIEAFVGPRPGTWPLERRPFR